MAYSVSPATSNFKATEGLILKVPLDPGSIFNGAYAIDAEGYVIIPVLGRYYVGGKEPIEVAEEIGKRLSSYLKDTYVMAIPAIRLTLLGFWQRPGMHFVDPDALVWDACLSVGGPAGEVNMDEWKVVRGDTLAAISLLNEFSRGTTLRKAGVKSGDIFVIPVPNPQSGFWYWFKESLAITAQIAGVISATLTVYITYIILEDRGSSP